MKVVFFISFALVFGLTLSCSSKRQNKPDLILIFVEELGFNEVNCLQRSTLEAEVHLNPDESGFEVFCEDSVRFTHSFTNSTFAPASIASVFTAQLPHVHGLRTIDDSLDRNWTTIAEQARLQNFSTAFFSGGVPVTRQSGLHQGFEFFDDNSRTGELFVPLERNLGRIESWLVEEKNSRIFLSLYIPDLRYKTRPTFTQLGEPRNISFRSQISELDENLKRLTEILKKNGRWDNSYVFLIGINGSMETLRAGQPARLGLLTEHVQTSLFVKPPKQPRDTGIAWSVDENISTIDIGQTLFTLLESKPNSTKVKPGSQKFQGISFSESLISPKSNLPRGRTIVIENPWTKIALDQQIYLSARKDNLVYLHEENPRVYNSLSDRFELNPVMTSEEPYQSFYRQMSLELSPIGKTITLKSKQTLQSLEKIEALQIALRNYSRCENYPSQIPLIAEALRKASHKVDSASLCLLDTTCPPHEVTFLRRVQRVLQAQDISSQDSIEITRQYRWQILDRWTQLLNMKYDFLLIPFEPSRLSTDLDRFLSISQGPMFIQDLHKKTCLELKTEWSL